MKNFESKAVSLLRGLPLSHVQSQSEKGSIFGFFVGAAAESLEGCERVATAGAEAGAGTAVTAVAGVVAAGDAAADVRAFSSASSCSMRAFMASSSFKISSEIAVFEAAGVWPADASGVWLAAATFAGASGCG